VRHVFECALNRWIACLPRTLSGLGRVLSIQVRTRRHGRLRRFYGKPTAFRSNESGPQKFLRSPLPSPVLVFPVSFSEPEPNGSGCYEPETIHGEPHQGEDAGKSYFAGSQRSARD
jgi:hypothetical protein